MNKLKVAFSNPEAGWVTMAIDHKNETLGIVASHVFETFRPLTLALHQVRDEQGESTITLLSEPEQCVLQFNRVGDDITLTIQRFPGHLRVPQLSTQLLRVSGSYQQICLPFWRALRALQGRFTEQEMQARWKEPFPTIELANLTVALKFEAIRGS